MDDRHAVGTRSDRQIRIDGVDLAYDDEGSGPAIVCTHAVGHGAGDFAGFTDRHCGRWRVIALDWPGHGRSSTDQRPPSSGRYGELLVQLLDALDLENAILLGNSIGGGAALRAAAARPGRVRGAVVCNSSGLVAHGLQKRLFTGALARFYARGARGGRWTRRAFAAMYRGVLSEPPAAEHRERIVATWPGVAPLLADAWRSFGQPDDDLSPILPTIDCPVLVTWSVGDRLNPLAFNRPGIALLPKGRLATFPGGHAPFLECPAAFDAAFAAFADALPS